MSSEMESKKATAILGVPGRLLALQEGSGLKSKADFLRAVKIQKGQWARYLKGEMPGLKVRQRIAQATGRSAEWILTGSEKGQEPRQRYREATDASGAEAIPALLHVGRASPPEARSVQGDGHAILIREVDGVPLTYDEQAICFPLVQALISLLRKNESDFAHLLLQTQWALSMSNDGANGHLRDAIRVFEAKKGFSVRPGIPPRPPASSRGEQQRRPRRRRPG